MINITGESGKCELEKILDVTKYLKIPYSDVHDKYYEYKTKVMENYPSLPVENINNLLFVQSNALRLTREYYESLLL